MTTIDLTRQQVDQAEALTFPTPDAPPLALATLSYHGVPVQLDVCALTEQTLKDIERRVSRLLERDGWSAPVATVSAGEAAAETRAVPVCQYHGPMKESTKAPGTFFCTKKMGDGSYCKERA